MDKTERRKELLSLLGDLPPYIGEVACRKVMEEDKGTYILEKLLLDLNGIEIVPAYFVKPKGVTGKLPAILYNHAHGGKYHIGKDELIMNNGYMQDPPYAEELTKLGYCALCIDAWVFGERKGRTESEVFKEMLWTGKVMWGMMVYDSIRAVDYLVSRSDVDSERIGTLGLSMGSTMAWWTAALDERLKLCVDICCLTDFQALIEAGGLDGHGIFYYVPKLLKHFTTSEINTLISPRPHLGLAGTYDKLTPLKGLERIDRELKEVYKNDGNPDGWKMIKYNNGHMETAAMRADIIEFLRKWL